MKHAYLIMAHGSWRVLEKQLRLLDSGFNDFYIHIDKKAQDVPDIGSWLSKSGVWHTEPMDVKWADYSMVECLLRLIKAAVGRGGYSYFHVISGADMPLKPAEEIYRFFESSGKNFVGFDKGHRVLKSAKYYHPAVEWSCYRRHKLLKGIDRGFEYVQAAVGINRLRREEWEIKHGWNWVSMRPELAQAVLDNEEKLQRIFHKTIAPDEMTVQTVAFNCGFMDELYDLDVQKGGMRRVDWQRGTPYVWGSEPGKTESDFDELMSCSYMFARKFDEAHMEIVEKIYNELSSRGK